VAATSMPRCTRRLRRALIRFVMSRADLVNPGFGGTGCSGRFARRSRRPRRSASRRGSITERFTLPRQRAGGPMTMICTRKPAGARTSPKWIVQPLVRVAEQVTVFRFTLCRSGRKSGGATLGARAWSCRAGSSSSVATPKMHCRPCSLARTCTSRRSLWDGTSPGASRGDGPGRVPRRERLSGQPASGCVATATACSFRPRTEDWRAA